MGKQTLHTDIAIIGGGIAGLWTLNQLRNRGYSAILFEQQTLGGFQTMGSQGMIHGGIKYALGGNWNGSSQAISAMPAVWRECLQGGGPVDLRSCKILSEDFFLWSSSGLQSRVSAFLASKMLRGQVQNVAAQDYPAPLRSARFRGQVYRLPDLVLDVPSLVDTLAARQRDCIFQIDWSSAALQRENGGAVLALPGCTVVPRRLLLTAGAGNEALISILGSRGPAMQRRPLQQVLVRHCYREPFFAHCMGGSAAPRLTISSHYTRLGEPVWYLGGDLATAGANEDPVKLIEKAKLELKALLPWLDLGATAWRTLRLDRAEPHQAGPRQAGSPAVRPGNPASLSRPERAFVGRLDSVDNTLAAWPTKLTLTPDLADQIERQFAVDNILPRQQPDLAPLAALGRPAIATPCWDTLFQ